MNLSTRGRYATRAMLELALRYDEGPVPTAAISASQGISERYLQQLLGSLKRAGLVRATHGAKGGFMLAAPPSATPLSAILDSVEGKLSLVECVFDERFCPRAGECLSREIWVEASRLLNEYFRSLTLADVLAKCAARGLNPLESACDRAASRRGARRSAKRSAPV